MDRRLLVVPSTLLSLALVGACAARATTASLPGRTGATAEAAQVEVIRTSYGVPHIYADNFRALGYALGYLQLEDYGDRVPLDPPRRARRAGAPSGARRAGGGLRQPAVLPARGRDLHAHRPGHARRLRRVCRRRQPLHRAPS